MHNDPMPDSVLDPAAHVAWLRRQPGVIFHDNPNPVPWSPPTDIRVINVLDINELTGDDWDDEEES